MTSNSDVTIASLSDLVEFLRKTILHPNSIGLYRGHAAKSYDLLPSLFRNKELLAAEKNILRELIAIQPDEFREDRTAFDQLVRMQHYGLPTRLLDLTYNPLVALYFACVKEETKDGEVILLLTPKMTVKYFDGDSVSCVANLSGLTTQQRDEIHSFETDEQLKNSETGERLLHFIKAEKPYFIPKIRLLDLKDVFLVRPKQTNKRILAQQGAFLIFGLESTIGPKFIVLRLRVPFEAKPKLLKELDNININGSTLFPEIESAAKYIISKITVASDHDERLE